jgi:hypothetical protein
MPRPLPPRGPRKPIRWDRIKVPRPKPDAQPSTTWRPLVVGQEVAPDWLISPSRRRPVEITPLDCLLYPLRDGPGVALLVFFPPLLWVMSVPIFDVVAALWPHGKFNALALIIIPLTMPLLISFSFVVGYIALFLGQVLVANTLGESDHPDWPEWDRYQILEGLGRLCWAVIIGVAVGGIPALIYWINCGDIDWIDAIIFVELVALGAGYAQMALIAALVHENILAANPYTVIQAIFRMGWSYLIPCVVTAVALTLAALALAGVLFYSPSIGGAALGLWAFWVFALYEAMIVLRVLGLTYYRHADDLAWFHSRPRWARSSRTGRIYANS